MYREEFRDRRDDYERNLDSPRSRYLPPRETYFEERVRERPFEFDDLERKRYGPPPSIDDPFYRRSLGDLEPRLSRPSEKLMEDVQDPNTGTIVCGSVIIIPQSPLEPKPKRREKPHLCNTVFVGSLPDNTTHKHLHDLFSKCGKVMDIRISKGRNFGHVQYEFEEDVERAMMLSGCRIRVGPTNTLEDVSTLHIDYAQPRFDVELQKHSENTEPLEFSVSNAAIISSELHRDESFFLAAKNTLLWIERGRCSSVTTNTFFGLISSCNTHCRKVGKKVKDLDKEEEDWKLRKQKLLEKLEKECKLVEDVLSTACTQRAWDNFTKPQRKSITQWKDYCSTVRKDVNDSLNEFKDEEPAAKKVKVDSNSDEVNEELEEMKAKHEAVLRRREPGHTTQLLITRFKQRFPKEWEKVIGGDGSPKMAAAPAASSKPSSDEDDQTAKEPISGALAASAAAYAKTRIIVGSSDETQPSGINETEAAIITVLSTFLTVNPLGATVQEITAYFKNFNSAITSIYLESLLHRLPKVFQLSQTGDGERKWWFLGFQTCCTQVQYTLDQEMSNETEQSGTSSK